MKKILFIGCTLVLAITGIFTFVLLTDNQTIIKKRTAICLKRAAMATEKIRKTGGDVSAQLTAYFPTLRRCRVPNAVEKTVAYFQSHPDVEKINFNLNGGTIQMQVKGWPVPFVYLTDT
ncbi:MAG: hypothetical protein AAB932_00595 [Patescibacteria group bacterium]